MKVLLFGAGVFYRKHQKSLKELPDTTVIGFIDNDSGLWGKKIDGLPVYAPEEGLKFHYEKILLMSIHGNEMDRQLQKSGVPPGKILRFEEYCAYRPKGKTMTYYGDIPKMQRGKGVLVITTDLGYNGGSLAAVYAADALRKRGYLVTVTAPDADRGFLCEIRKQGLPVIICPGIKFEKPEQLSWTEPYDYILVNTFQMYPCAIKFCRKKNTLWWLHEPLGMYENILKQYPGFSEEELQQCKVAAVSSIAKENLNRFFPHICADIMPYGIWDTFDGKDEEFHKKQIFAVIGNVCPIKGQDIFIQAADLLTDDEKSRAEFWIIGRRIMDEFGERIGEMAASRPYIKLLGEKSRGELESLYRKIHTIVVPSREDTMSIAATEGMMWKKVCIISEAAGIAGYIKDGENGLLCRAGDAADLSRKFQWTLEHKERLKAVGENARQTYEKFFTMDSFGERLEGMLHKTMCKCCRKVFGEKEND